MKKSKSFLSKFKIIHRWCEPFDCFHNGIEIVWNKLKIKNFTVRSAIKKWFSICVFAESSMGGKLRDKNCKFCNQWP